MPSILSNALKFEFINILHSYKYIQLVEHIDVANFTQNGNRTIERMYNSLTAL